MYGLRRMKRVTDPFDDKARARIVGGDRSTSEPDSYVSSGSEHSAHDVISPPADHLSELFFDFEINGGGSPTPSSAAAIDSDDSECDHPSMCERNVELIRSVVLDQRDDFKNVLKAHVLRAVEVFSCNVRMDKGIMRRNVMSFLRDYGYNAAVCKTKWCGSGGLTAGSYEFIDVVRADNTRYFLDLDFASEFEIARPTGSYEKLLQQLPRVFVGKDGDLKVILKAVSDGAKRSLKSRGLLLPPWRKHRFMQNKWFGPYRRTANLFPATFASPSPAVDRSYGGVKCRAVGFDAAASGGGGGLFVFPATARTR